MNKQKSFSLGVLVVLVIGVLYAAITMPQDRVVYINEENGFRMTFPASWRGRFEVVGSDELFLGDKMHRIVNTTNRSAEFDGVLAA